MEIIDHTKKTKLNYKFYYNPLPKEAAESEVQQFWALMPDINQQNQDKEIDAIKYPELFE